MPKNRTPDPLRLPASRRPVPTRTRIRTLRIPLTAYVAFLLILPIAVIATARATGWWATTGRTVPATALGAPDFGEDSRPGDGAGKGADGQAGEAGQGGAGQSAGAGNGDSGGSRPENIVSAQDVRGSMTVQEVIDAFPR
jgi:hypothetical protein